MGMATRLAAIPPEIVRVPMMRVMDVCIGVFEWLMRVRMAKHNTAIGVFLEDHPGQQGREDRFQIEHEGGGARIGMGEAKHQQSRAHMWTFQ